MANCASGLSGLSNEDLAAIANGDMEAPPNTVLGEGWGWAVVLGTFNGQCVTLATNGLRAMQVLEPCSHC